MHSNRVMIIGRMIIWSYNMHNIRPNDRHNNRVIIIGSYTRHNQRPNDRHMWIYMNPILIYINLYEFLMNLLLCLVLCQLFCLWLCIFLCKSSSSWKYLKRNLLKGNILLFCAASYWLLTSSSLLSSKCPPHFRVKFAIILCQRDGIYRACIVCKNVLVSS